MNTVKIPYDNMQPATPPVRLYNRCCFCIPLRTGCLILGYFNIIITFLLIGFSIYQMAVIRALTHGFDHTGDDMKYEVLREAYPAFVKMERLFYNMSGTVLTMLIALLICWVAVSIYCVIGVHKKNPKPIRAFIVFASARIFIHLVMASYIILQHADFSDALVFMFIEFSVNSYYVLIYHFYAKRLEYDQSSNTKQII